jgi:predicted enzyme related to lactoylglutathione lyase
MTTDVEAAKAFYTEVIGWTVKGGEGAEPYYMWTVGERPVGGLMTLPPEARQYGAPPHWLGYLGTPDVDATVGQAQQLGASVLVPTQEIPGVGRFAIVADPQRAALGVFAMANEMPSVPPEPGDITWNELNSTDWESAWKFYSELFGWTETEAMDMGPEAGTYFMFKDASADSSIGGMSNMAKAQGLPAHWLFYVTVADLEAALERVKGNGGKVLNGPMEVPGGDRVAQCMDPQGALFALHWRKA